MAGKEDRFKKIALQLGNKITDLLVEEDVYVDSLLYALEDLDLSQGEQFLEVTTKQLRAKNLSREHIEAFEIVQGRYKDIHRERKPSGEVKNSSAVEHSSDDPSNNENAGGNSSTTIPVNSKSDAEDHIPNQIDKSFYYEMQPQNGHGLLILNTKFNEFNDRKVAEKELGCLNNTAELLKIPKDNLKIHENKTANEIEEVINNFVGALKKENTSLVFIAICSHGDNTDKICGVEYPFENVSQSNDFLLLSKIEKMLCECENLTRLPKIFLIQTCTRGKEKEQKDEKDPNATDGQTTGPISYATCTSDTVILFAHGKDDFVCNPGGNEPFFLSEFNKCLKENKNCHFAEILTILSRRISGKVPEDFIFTHQSSLQGFLQFEK